MIEAASPGDSLPNSFSDFYLSSYKIKGYPLGCSESEFFIALGDNAFFLVDKNSNKVGIARVESISEENKWGDFSVYMSPSEDHSSLLSSFVEFFWENFSLRKIYVSIFSTEMKLAEILYDTGFNREISLKEHFFINGQYVDVLVFGKFCDGID